MSFTKIFKTGCRLFLLVLVGLLLYFNAAFYYSPGFETDESGTWNEDVYQQLSHLKNEMHSGAATDMQQLFPEGHLFMNALYGLAWVDLLTPTLLKDRYHKYASLPNTFQSEALDEIRWAKNQMASERAKAPFPTNQAIPHGVFYHGWSAYVQARWFEIHPTRYHPATGDVGQLQHNCGTIAQMIDDPEVIYLSSYPDGTWPADNVVAMATLSAYDRIIGTPRYRPIIDAWLTKVKTQLDPATGLIPHVVYEGAPPQGARGSSQSLILSLLPEIDSVFAAEQFALFEKHFVTSRLGLPAVREYPKGVEGKGDVDSGPIIWDIGGAASVVGQRAALVNGNEELYVGLRNSIEAFGFAYTWFGEKKYLAGKLPMADAFIAWSNAAEKQPVNAPYPKPWLIHLISIVILLTLIWVVYRI